MLNASPPITGHARPCRFGVSDASRIHPDRVSDRVCNGSRARVLVCISENLYRPSLHARTDRDFRIATAESEIMADETLAQPDHEPAKTQ